MGKMIRFSNGEEYRAFLSTFCHRCNKYDMDECSKENCEIDYKIALAQGGAEHKFPHDDLEPSPRMCRYICKGFENDDPKIMESYKHALKNAPHEMEHFQMLMEKQSEEE